MNNLDSIENILSQDTTIWATLIKTVVVLVFTQILAWHYIRYANVISNRQKFSRILIFLSVTTMLVISVVKTSLALSLGLVGALSIIRFRTPVKEPEELAYLFLAMAIGIGIGANQYLVTLLVSSILLIYLAIGKANLFSGSLPHSLLQVSIPLSEHSSGEADLKELTSAASSMSERVDIRRVDRHNNILEATIVLDFKEPEAIHKLLTIAHEQLPKASITIVDKDSLE